MYQKNRRFIINLIKAVIFFGGIAIFLGAYYWDMPSDLPPNIILAVQSDRVAPETERDYIIVGEDFTTDIWNIKFISAREHESITTDIYQDIPDNGDKYLILFFEVKNISTEEQYFNYYDFDLYVDNFKEDFSLVINKVEGNRMLSGMVDANSDIKGFIALEVSSDWRNVELKYDGNRILLNTYQIDKGAS